MEDSLEAFCTALTPLVKAKGWSRLTRYDLQLVAKKFPDLSENILEKNFILELILRRGEQSAFSSCTVLTPTLPIKDNLFDSLMAFFDGISPFKPLLQTIYHHDKLNAVSLNLLRQIEEISMAFLEMTGVKVSSWRGYLRSRAFVIVFGGVFSVWIKDDSPDGAQTMAAVDRYLSQAQEVAGLLGI